MEETGGFSMSMLVIPGVIMFLAIVAIALVRVFVKNYITVPRNQAAVLSGKKTGEDGYQVYTGGSFFKWPVLQRLDWLSLNMMTFAVQVQDVPDKNGVLVTVRGIANVKIDSKDEQVRKAVERFLGKSEREIADVAKENLESSLRGIVGTMTVEELIQDRQTFQQAAIHEAGSDMAKLGISVEILNIQEITDSKEYIHSLGRARTAEVLRDAKIGEAQAKRDADIQAAEADREGAVAVAKAAEQTSDAERERDMTIARNQARVEAEQARIPLAAQAAAAEGQEQVNIAQVAAEQARAKAEIELQDTKRRRREAELDATTVVEAAKTKEARLIEAGATSEALVIEATGKRESAELNGEAARIQAEKQGLGTQAKMTAEAAGRIEAAKATQAEAEAAAAGRKAELLAEAEGEERKLLAQAAGTKARVMAEADGREALLLAEAKGAEAKAKAFRELDDAGRFLMVLDSSAPIIESLGEAAAKVMVPMAQAIGQGLGNVKEIRLVEIGSSNGADGSNVLSRFMSAPAETLMDIMEKSRATGTAPALAGFFKKAGIDLSQVMSGETGEAPSEDPTET